MANTKPDVDQITKWLDAIAMDGVNLTAWEEDFISSMQGKVEAYGDRAHFSDKMAETIEKIYTDRCP